MLTRLRKLLSHEGGYSSAALFILGFPMIIGVFGLAFDSARFLYIRDYVENQANLALASAVNTAYTNVADGRIYLGSRAAGTGAALSVGEQLYLTNTDAKRRTSVLTNDGFLSPSGTSFGGQRYGTPTASVVGRPVTLTELCLNPNATTSKYGVSMTVREQMPTTFLKVLGIQTLEMQITVSSLIRARNC
jgi:hypothetical protein